MELRIGDTHTIRLAGLGTVGYEWNYNVEGEHSVIEISRRSALEEDDNKKNRYDNDKRLPIGQSIDEVFIIKGVSVGRAIVHFLQRRPWEIDVPPLNKADVEVIVLRK
jgi:predicted secreted protein